MTTVERGFMGTMPLGSERDDDSYLDFTEGVRVFNTQIAQAMQARGKEAIAEYEARTGRKITTIEEANAALKGVPVVDTLARMRRSSQEMMWQGVIDTYKKREKELLAELDRYDKMGPGTVEYDPNFVYPKYFADVEFHIQPGGYYADPLAGYIYHYGTKVFFTGRNNNDGVQREIVARVPLPKDGQVRRIVDLACSAGQSATALKERFPQAEVWATDISAPMVRYAHKRAVDMGLEIHCAQRAAEDTKFPSNSVDIVHAFILFHEIPHDIIVQTVKEAHRILRPGGVFVVQDFNSRPAKGPQSFNPLAEYNGYFDSTMNGEPYAPGFVHMDFTGLLKSVFSEVNDDLAPGQWLQSRAAWK